MGSRLSYRISENESNRNEIIRHSCKANIGLIEDTNNSIKVLNNVSYGYRNFTNYHIHIFISFKLKRANQVS